MIEYIGMKLIVGLGNPGAQYKNTRHNIGFMAIDNFAKNLSVEWKYSPDWVCYFIKKADYLLIKPKTFMNSSGNAAKAVVNFYKINLKEILVIHDELDLDFGKIRLSFDSTSAGHKGVESVIKRVGSFEFARLRIGIGSPRKTLDEINQPTGVDGEKYVLENFSKKEQVELPKIIKQSQQAIESYIDEGISATMNRFN